MRLTVTLRPGRWATWHAEASNEQAAPPRDLLFQSPRGAKMEATGLIINLGYRPTGPWQREEGVGEVVYRRLFHRVAA